MDEVFKISINKARAKALLEMAEERFKDMKKEDKPYKIVEQYYEIIKELATALMYLDGFKTLSHKALLQYLEEKYNDMFSKEEFIIMDELRRLRNDILYYGLKISPAFLKNKEEGIKSIIRTLIAVIRNKIK